MSNNPFSKLNLPLRFSIEKDAIERAYLTLLSSNHPDAGGNGTDEINSAEINAAREVLLNDEKRANALLGVLGGPSSSQCKDLPDGFLMEMMSLRQEIEEELAQADESARAKWEAWAQEQRRAYCDQVAALFNTYEQTDDPQILKEIRITLNAWRYIERLVEQLDPHYDPADADFR